MAWTAPAYPITGQLITAAFIGAIMDNLLILKTCVDDNGHMIRIPFYVTSSQNLPSTADVAFTDTSAGAVAVGLPLAASVPNRTITVPWWAGANAMSVVTQGADRINIILSSWPYSIAPGNGQMESHDFYSNTNGWWLFG